MKNKWLIVVLVFLIMFCLFTLAVRQKIVNKVHNHDIVANRISLFPTWIYPIRQCSGGNKYFVLEYSICKDVTSKGNPGGFLVFLYVIPDFGIDINESY